MTRTPRLRGFGRLFQLTAPTMTPTLRLRGFGCPFQPSYGPTMMRTPRLRGFGRPYPMLGPCDGPYDPYDDDVYPSFHLPLEG